MKIEIQNNLGINVVLGQAEVSCMDGALRSPSGEVFMSSDTAAILRVDAALVESVRHAGGAQSVTCELSSAEVRFGLLLMRIGSCLTVLVFDLARQDVIRWLGTSVKHDYLPVVLVAGDRAIQVRLSANQRVRDLLDSSRHCRLAGKEELFSAFSAALGLLEDLAFLRGLSIDPANVSTANLMLLAADDSAGISMSPTDGQSSPVH